MIYLCRQKVLYIQLKHWNQLVSNCLVRGYFKNKKCVDWIESLPLKYFFIGKSYSYNDKILPAISRPNFIRFKNHFGYGEILFVLIHFKNNGGVSN